MTVEIHVGLKKIFENTNEAAMRVKLSSAAHLEILCRPSGEYICQPVYKCYHGLHHSILVHLQASEDEQR